MTKKKKEEIQPELSDILEMIRRYNAANRHQCCFIFDFLAFEHGKKTCKLKDKAMRLGMYGHIEQLRLMLNELRDFAEDAIDENGFVNI